MSKRPKNSEQSSKKVASPWVDPKMGRDFFENDEICALRDRAVEYARAGVPIHFSGPAGLGKTALAFEVARALGRDVAVMTGNAWLSASDFIGGTVGSSTSTVVDRYVHSVQRTERQTRNDWSASILAQAMVEGQTLIYDEFTRATPEANSTMLSVLEEGILICTDPSGPQQHLRAHPDFRVVLTSNPHDYVAVNTAPDALLDRVATFQMQAYRPETVAQIVTHRTGLDSGLAFRLAHLLGTLGEGHDGQGFSVLRTSILVGRIAAFRAQNGNVTDKMLAEIATAILNGRGVKTNAAHVNTAMKQVAAE